MEIEIYSAANLIGTKEQEVIATFLEEHLEEYGDPKEEIMLAIEDALATSAKKMGGWVFQATQQGKIVGATVVLRTGMSKYIPENILVYIAVDKASRGQGVGKLLLDTVIKTVKGGVALHVEPQNPAKGLYEKLGFENKYLEMRYSPKS